MSFAIMVGKPYVCRLGTNKDPVLQWAIGCHIFKCHCQIILFAERARLHEARDIRLVFIRRGPHHFLVISTMATETQRHYDALISSLNTAIDTLNRAKGATSVAPAKAAFTSAGVLLTVIRVGFVPVHVGRLLANVCRTRWPKQRTTSNWG